MTSFAFLAGVTLPRGDGPRYRSTSQSAVCEPRRHFLAPAAVIAMGTLRILSSDPDEEASTFPSRDLLVQTLAAPTGGRAV